MNVISDFNKVGQEETSHERYPVLPLMSPPSNCLRDKPKVEESMNGSTSQGTARTHKANHSWTSWGSVSNRSQGEQAEELGPIMTENYTEAPKYRDGDTIDWFEEESEARSHAQIIKSGRGLRGFLTLLLDNATLWSIVLITGIGIGTIGGWLDILVAWLADLRLGRCAFNLAYKQSTCCKGYDAGEFCKEWMSWAEFFGIKWTPLQSLLQSFTYVTLSVAFAGAAAVLVKSYAPFAFHTGIPEIKAILGGFVFDQFLSPWTLLIKSLGLALSVASGLSLGKEGPLVHVSCCLAYLALSRFRRFRGNEAEKRRILAAAAAAGVSVAFGSPLGGVLFALEELDVFHEEVMWRSFVTSVIAAVSLQYIDAFGTSKLVRFQVSGSNEAWRAFELVPWVCLGIIGGLVGTVLIRINATITAFRHNSQIKDWPLVEVLAVSAITAALSYVVVFARVQTSELVANLFLECDAEVSYHGLCNPTANIANIFLLLTTATLKTVLTAWTFGITVPAGIFLPTIAIGACIGRAFGLAVQALHRLSPSSVLFSACPPDPTVRCISPGFYAVIGATGVLAGVTRMTISLVVIMFELTGALSHVLPLMIVVMTAKWVADSFGKDGIYAVWIAMHRYPWLSPIEYRDSGRTSEDYMMPTENLTVIDSDDCSIGALKKVLRQTNYRGFPVTRNGTLLGYLRRTKLMETLRQSLSSRVDHDKGTQHNPVDDSVNKDDNTLCTFEGKQPEMELSDTVDLSTILETPAFNLRKEVPLELVVSIFQKMNIHYLLFSQEGRLTGLIAKSDIASLLSSGIPEAGILTSGKTHIIGIRSPATDPI